MGAAICNGVGISFDLDFIISGRKYFKCLLLLLFAFGASLTMWAQNAPPNDNYTNRIQLVGSDVTFSGTTIGATLDDGEGMMMGNAGLYGPSGQPPGPTVWWTWTAPISGQVTVSLASNSDSAIRQGGAFIAFYDFINWDPDPDLRWGTTPYGKNLDLPGFAQFSFYAEAGTNYDIQVCTPPQGTFTFHLLQTNAPSVLVSPRDRAVAINDNTFFGVMPGGLPPFTYQWRFNGADLVGETHSILAVENVDSTRAGAYSVVVSNSYGSVESRAATLILRTNFLAPQLSAVRVNADATVSFTLAGEPLTYYRIQSSTNLVDWANEQSFPKGQYNGYVSGFTSVILNKDLTTTVTVPYTPQRRFYRAVVYQPAFNPTNSTLAQTRLCINNLRRVRFAKEFWFTERTFDPYNWPHQPIDTPASTDLDWGSDLTGPHCSGGQACMDSAISYQDGITFPQCTIDADDHVLEEPADEY